MENKIEEITLTEIPYFEITREDIPYEKGERNALWQSSI
jgi:hypothetical protein